MKLLSNAAILFLAGAIAASASPFAITEGVDFSNNPLSPTNLSATLDFGTNTITGTLFRGGLLTGDLFDGLQFTKLPSETITAIRIITTGYHGGLVSGIFLASGAVTGTTAITGNGTFDLAFSPGSGNTVTFDLTPPAVAAGGFNYTFEIVATPEPGTLAMLGLGGALVAAVARRRRA